MGWEAVAAAGALGVMSVPHCAAMCGPIAVLSCGRREQAGYLFARVIGYATVGSAMGWLGAHTLARIGDSAGRVALLSMALVCLWRAWVTVRRDEPRLVVLGKQTRRGALWSVAQQVVALWPRRGAGLGLATAILPCGALAAAWTTAAASGHPAMGALAMTVFALASSPALLVAMFGRRIVLRVIDRVPRVAVAAAWLLGAAVLVGRAWWIHTSCH